MSAAEHLSPTQFVHWSVLANAKSGDYLGSTVEETERQRLDDDEGHAPEYQKYHGVEGYTKHLTRSIAKGGMQEPIQLTTHEDGSSTVHDGHHRALAAIRLQMDRVPVVDHSRGAQQPR